MADLTRFDFNAKEWIHSETIQVMTDAEIGQYIQLLVQSWMIGKAATIPDDPKTLARWAHCEQVSERVLEKFPLSETEFGCRRRNPTLYQEWLAATARSIAASENGKRGNDVRWNQPSGSDRRAIAEQSLNTIQTNNTKPIQTNNNGHGDFRYISTHFFSFFGFHLGSNEKAKDAYHQACSEFGEDFVLEQFDLWAPNNDWVRDKKAKFALPAFYRTLPTVRDAMNLRKQRESSMVTVSLEPPPEVQAQMAAKEAEKAVYVPEAPFDERI